jgi:hypothetical protein
MLHLVERLKKDRSTSSVIAIGCKHLLDHSASLTLTVSSTKSGSMGRENGKMDSKLIADLQIVETQPLGRLPRRN